MNAQLNKHETEFGVTALSVALKMLGHGDCLLGKMPERSSGMEGARPRVWEQDKCMLEMWISDKTYRSTS
jgi:hypothetical protein